MPIIRANIVQPSTSINRHNVKVLPKRNNLFAFSSILSNKYAKGRLAISTISLDAQQSASLSTPFSNISDVKRSHQSFFQKPSTTDLTMPRTEHSQKQNSAPKHPNNNRHRRRRFIPFIIAFLVVILFACIAAILLGILYKSQQQITTTSTSTGTSTTSSTTTATTTVTTTTTTTTTTDTTTTTTTTACYFGQDYVDLVEGGRRQISRLKTGDQVWTISHDGKRLIQDEIMCIPHAGPTTPTYFYTFKTLEEHTISLTDSHFILAMAKDEDKIKIIRASEVTLEHRLIMNHRTIGIEQIVYSERIGFYSPITLSGYLTVNNLSTSVYVEFLHAPHGFLHQITGPFRIYYRIARWLFGNNYAPFGITVKDEIHPISSFIVANYEPIRLVFTSFPLIKPIMFIVSFIYAIKHILLYKKKTVII
ncbi:unnamed protein product [Rotaria magnacalcarata]|uniref:Hedgehog protein Hint domain-containing protein n=2 Tax=Rotaria magnacalcarata TaxID=392030 RepID=A0A816XBU4_9BILA|nr:unnamed protein product [Rotaria magnacalcarata]